MASPVPENAVYTSNEAYLRGLLASDVTVPIAYTGAAPTAELVIPKGKTVYLAGSAITLEAHLAVEADAKLVLTSSLTTDGTGKLLLVNGTVKVGMYGALAYKTAATEVTDYTVAAGALTPGSNTVIGTKVSVLANGSLQLATDDVVTTTTANKFTQAEARTAAGAGHLGIVGSTALFSVSDLVALPTATRGIMATTSKTDALPNLIPKTAHITVSGEVISVGTVENRTLTVNGSLTLSGAATLENATSITVGHGGSFIGNNAATTLEAVTAITVGMEGSFSATNATGAATGVKVVVDQIGQVTLATVAKLLQSSSVGTAGQFTVTAVTAFDTSATLAVSRGAVVNGIAFPGATAVTEIGADAFTIGNLTVPAGATFTVPAGKTFTVDKQKTLEINGTLAFTDASSKVIIEAEGSLKADEKGAFHAKAGDTTDGSAVALTVAATGNTGTATPYTSDDVAPPAAVTLTTAAGGAGSNATAYVIGNASFAVNNKVTAGSDGTAVTSTAAASSAAAGTITAAADSAIVLVGKS
jgi:hypothetical protein